MVTILAVVFVLLAAALAVSHVAGQMALMRIAAAQEALVKQLPSLRVDPSLGPSPPSPLPEPARTTLPLAALPPVAVPPVVREALALKAAPSKRRTQSGKSRER